MIFKIFKYNKKYIINSKKPYSGIIKFIEILSCNNYINANHFRKFNKLSFNLTKLNCDKNDDQCISCKRSKLKYNYHLLFKCPETNHFHANNIDVLINTSYDISNAYDNENYYENEEFISKSCHLQKKLNSLN